MKLESTGEPSHYRRQGAFFYGWYIVGVGFFSHLVSAFHFSSTLSVFVKPITEEFRVSRGLFSMLRTGEILISGAMAPIIGPLVDRYSGRWLMAIGALVAGAGFILLSQITAFWQFMLARWILVTIGGALMGYMVVNVSISRWFIRKRGRAIAIATLGQGIAKVGIPLLTASLFLWLGWRHTWTVFGVLTLALVVGPAIAFMRRAPEDMGLYPDGDTDSSSGVFSHTEGGRVSAKQRQENSAELTWSRAETLRTQAFWLITFTFGISNVGIAGLNLHIFAYVTDIGHTSIVAATVLTVIAFTQMGSTLLWGFLSERMDIRKATMLKFFIQASGLSLVISSSHLAPTYVGFLLYGIGLGGSQVLQEVIWAGYFGRISLGTVRGLGILVTHAFAAVGPPFFGFLFDATKSYFISFALFTISLIISAFLILLVRPPRK